VLISTQVPRHSELASRVGRGRCWRYAYRFAGKYRTLALGIYPDFSACSTERDSRVQRIYGGTTEIVKDLIARKFFE
jgi:alkylation response protein AidB-like acyl-CoA dehydrogenase